jgi:predicted dienelactone hydrolase
MADARASHRDRRIRAIVAMAPVMGPGVPSTSLRSVAIPVLIFGSPTDELVPFRGNAASYARRIPHARLVKIPEAGHMVFMPVCSEPGPIVAAEVCNDRTPAVDRAAVHAIAIERTIPFLDRALGVRAPAPTVRAAARP